MCPGMNMQSRRVADLKQPQPRGTARVIFFIDASSNKHQSTIRKSRTCNTSPQKKIPSGKLT